MCIILFVTHAVTRVSYACHRVCDGICMYAHTRRILVYHSYINCVSHHKKHILYIMLLLLGHVATAKHCRGSIPRGSLLYGHTWLETPDPVRSPKLSNHGRV